MTWTRTGRGKAHGHGHHLEAVAGDDHHGDDHHGDDHHGDDHHESRMEAHEYSVPEPMAPDGLELEELPSGDAGSHPHPCLDRARSNRVECPAFALVTPTVAVAIEQVGATAPPQPVHDRIRPRTLAHAPPQPSRAPPSAARLTLLSR